jgi:CHAT domain
MKKFMEKGIIRSLTHKSHRGNLWVLASNAEVEAAQGALQSKGESLSSGATAESFSLPAHALLQTPKTTILFLAANPTGTDLLALDKECREIEHKIRASDHHDGIEFVTKWAVRTGDLLQYLNQHRAHVIHFSGHGSRSEELILLDAHNKAKPVSKAALKQLFATLKDNIRVVVLNACYSRPQAEAIVDVIDCAIGMNKGIGDEAAIVFAAAFYQAIGFGRPVKEAFESGKAALMLEGIPEENITELLVRKGADANAIFLIKPALQTN